MAKDQTIPEALIHKFEEELTCAVCREQYTDPKILPCFHSFCLNCLRGVLPQQGNHICCPTCRSPCELPQQGVDALPLSFSINNMTAIYKMIKVHLTERGQTSEKSLHGDKNDCDQLHVKFPDSVPVTTRGRVVKTITGPGLKEPKGLAVSDGHVIIGDCGGHCITIITKDGEKVRSFGSHGQFNHPCCIEITSKGTLLVADSGNNRIQEFTIDGKYISCVGDKAGDGPLQFQSPQSLAINKTTGQIYVADTWNFRVQVLNADLTFCHSFGSLGSGQGQLLSVILGVAVDSRGFVYVADTYNHRIVKFTPEGQFVSCFGSEGSQPGQLTRPNSILINNDVLYVTEWDPNNRISVYSTTTGHCLHCFGTLKLPNCLAMDPTTSYLFVCDDEGVHLF